MKKTLLILGASLSVLTAHAQTRIPLFEVFTSSTCGPCYNGNKVYESVIAGKPTSDFVSLKYQEYFPSTGDPYCTDETVARLGYYGINSIPRMEIDGAWDGNAGNFTQTLYDQYKNTAPKATVSGTYSIKERVVNGKVKFSPLVAIPAGTILYIAITEDMTVKNKKTNGETAFYDVVKKMIPNQAGQAISLTVANTKDSVSFSYTFPASYRLPADATAANRISFVSGKDTNNSVENFANLRVAAWLQFKNGTTKEVFNAARLTRVSPTDVGELSASVSNVAVYPNPASSNVTVDLNMKNIDLVSVKLINMTGAVVAAQSVPCVPGSNKVSFETANLAAGMYSILILDSKNNSFGQQVLIAH